MMPKTFKKRCGSLLNLPAGLPFRYFCMRFHAPNKKTPMEEKATM